MNATQTAALKKLRETVRECLAAGLNRTKLRTEVSLELASSSDSGRSKERFGSVTASPAR